MGLMKEFREFAVKGSAMDMAVGIVIGAAFGKIVSSLVADIIMPTAGMLTGTMDFSNKFVVLGFGDTAQKFKTLADAKAAGALVLSYGVFINAVVDFIIIAFAIFMMMKGINHLRRIEEALKLKNAPPVAAPPEVQREEVKLLAEIRDLLKKKQAS
jgi:large conductance mechanosensitive channel